MPSVHPLLCAAKESTNAAARALTRLIHELESNAPPFLSTVAINFWSPYLSHGRHTALGYPKANNGTKLADLYGGNENLLRIHHRYLTLLGRNLSANHLLVEVPNVSQITIDATARELSGPTPPERQTEDAPVAIRFEIPRRTEAGGVDECFEKLVPSVSFTQWLNWIRHEAYEQRYQGLLRDQLRACRLEARSVLPEAFARHLYTWVRKRWVPPQVGLAEFDDRWLARIQLTTLAAAMWGDIWVSHAFSVCDSAKSKLGLLASCTVTGRVIDSISYGGDNAFREIVASFAAQCSQRLQVLVQEEFSTVAGDLDGLDHAPWQPQVLDVATKFSNELGGPLIGADHEGKPISFRSLITPGLDSLPVNPSEVKVLHEIAQAEFALRNANEEHTNQWWHLWKAYFTSNDLFLARDHVALHFELDLSEDGSVVLPVPRHVVQLVGTPEDFLRSTHPPPEGLLQIGFETNKDRKIALHVRSRSETDGEKIETRVQTKGTPIDWGDDDRAEPDWGSLRDVLFGVIKLIRDTLKQDGFFKDAAHSLAALSLGQIRQLADGVAEVRRSERGCLVFIGPVYKDNNGISWFLDRDNLQKRVEITRLGVTFRIISQIPDTFSEDFRTRFADVAAMDGETIIHAARPEPDFAPDGFHIDRPPGSVEARRFVQLPQNTPALLHTGEPRISEAYAESWRQAAHAFTKSHADLVTKRKIVDCRAISDLQRTDLLSLGTRHRKAAMTTMAIGSIVGITCSASGKLKVWVRGVPVAELAPRADCFLPRLSPPDVPEAR
jgi:hypothetical protein